MPGSPKALSSRDRTSLKKEVLTIWNSNVPEKMSADLPWLALRHLIDDLREVLDKHFVDELLKIIEMRDASAYLRFGKRPDMERSLHVMHQTEAGFWASTFALSFLKKYPFGKLASVDPMATALKRFDLAEVYCATTNRRLKYYRYRFSRPLPAALDACKIFHLAREKIKRWLGPLDLNKIYDGSRHGPGGVVGLSRPATTAYYKYATEGYSVSNRAFHYARAAILADRPWGRAIVCENYDLEPTDFPDGFPNDLVAFWATRRLVCSNHNKVTFVPKTALTHRAIAIEPMMNVYLQLGVGAFIRRALKKAGCDLDDQTRNQKLARYGSSNHGPLDPATLDLEMASDTLSIELVRELIPPDWFDLLNALRSHKGRLGEKEITWNKFSSMGNGFTFELESMIFLALSESLSDHHGVTAMSQQEFGSNYQHLSVYGDDIIVPSILADRLIRFFRFCGFRTNQEKSFVTGPFRESCGEDYYEGTAVRPFYLKRKITRWKDAVFLYNCLHHHLVVQTPYSPLRRTSPDKLRSIVPGTLSTHLVGPYAGRHESYFTTNWEKSQQSRLVGWSITLQTFQYPLIKLSPEIYRGRSSYRYLQFLQPVRGSSLRNDVFDVSRFTDLTYAVSGSRGDVVRSGTVKSRISKEFSGPWNAGLGITA